MGGCAHYLTARVAGYPRFGTDLTKVDLIYNLKTAKTLGVEVPLPLLMRVSEVIE